MTLRSIAFKNIKGNLNKFVMYYLSNALVVMVFFIFANFMFNPQVKNVGVMGQIGAVTVEAMYLCEIVILVFTLVFTNYSISSFLKSREKEFGLLSLFGLTKGQIRSYILFENLIVAIFSIVTGLLFGILFSKLFFMAVSAILILDKELPLIVSVKAVLLTIACFLVLFQGIGFISCYRIKNNNIIELLRGSRVAKPVPKFSTTKAILSIVLIAIGYGMAVFSNQAIIFTMLPILIVTVAGTFMLYSQFSVYFTNKLQKNKEVFYKGINMITLSQIVYKLRDNSRILFAVSILSAVTLTASATVYSFQKVIQKNIVVNFPQDFSFFEEGLNSHKVIAPERVEQILKDGGQEISYKNKVVLINAVNESLSVEEKAKHSTFPNKTDFNLMSNSDYNALAKERKLSTITLKAGEIYINSYNLNGGESKKLFVDKKELKLNIEGKATTWRINQEVSGGIINTDERNASTAVVSDEEFNKLKGYLKDEKLKVYYGYSLNNWMKSSNSILKIKQEVPKEMSKKFDERVTDVVEMMKGMSLFFFIGTFISILFFIATGSILYFKLFNEVQKDKQEFIALKKMGLSIGEVKRIVSTQCAVMFFLPFTVAFIHTCFAIKALSNILKSNLSLYLMIIVGVYLLLQTAYYLFAKSMYIRQINSWE
ncbi:ABC transporter permease [Clostridium sp. YIM B02505]|uniref:ABC transporter permease n=1 Tax=Clostridium yunnanense TaxID=2800325 RepID=A0ABS1EPJ5_9CLOT|nr:ABC transporter permease [Clostridium yunnanense]MBK1811255.1 ABC transporter permease [Clostridium yunnanense]